MPKGSTKYIPGLHVLLCYYMAKDGDTLERMSEKLGISDRTLDNWCVRHPELKEAMKPGRVDIDNRAEATLLQRAYGYDIEEVTRERVEVGKKVDGSPKMRMTVTKRVTKHIPGDVTALLAHLNNRRPESWRNTARIDVRHSGSIASKPDLAKLSDEELANVRAIMAKAESVASSN